MHPSDDVILICEKTETVLRAAQNESGDKFLKKSLINTYLISKVLVMFIGNEKVFKELNEHSADHSLLENHSIHLIRAVVTKYLKVRIGFICSNKIAKSQSIRNMYNKLVHFKSQ